MLFFNLRIIYTGLIKNSLRVFCIPFLDGGTSPTSIQPVALVIARAARLFNEKKSTTYSNGLFSASFNT